MAPTLITRAELVRTFPVPKSRPSLREWVKLRGFPAPAYPTCNRPLWDVSAVEAWFENQVASHSEARKEGARINKTRAASAGER